MIEITMNEKKKSKLMKSRSSDLIVLFHEQSKGIQLNGGKEENVGSYTSIWDSNMFEDYNDPITIQNKC